MREIDGLFVAGQVRFDQSLIQRRFKAMIMGLPTPGPASTVEERSLRKFCQEETAVRSPPKAIFSGAINNSHFKFDGKPTKIGRVLPISQPRREKKLCAINSTV